MIPTDSRDLTLSATNNAAAANNSLCEPQPEYESFLAIDWRDRTVPGLDNLWIDLGGEG